MTQEEALMSEVKDIIETAAKQDEEQYDEYCKKVALQVEQEIWDAHGSIEAYELWCLRMRHRGTPESIAQLREETKADKQVVIKPENADINSCVELSIAYVAEQVKLKDLNELLSHHSLMLALQYREPTELVGFVARTGAWLSTEQGVRPSESDTKQSVTLTVYMCSGRMVVITRRDDTGEIMPDTMVIRYFTPSTADDQQEMVECCEHLDNTYGKSAAMLYAAWAFPRMFKILDPEIADALAKDALSSIDNKETEQ